MTIQDSYSFNILQKHKLWKCLKVVLLVNNAGSRFPNLSWGWYFADVFPILKVIGLWSDDNLMAFTTFRYKNYLNNNNIYLFFLIFVPSTNVSDKGFNISNAILSLSVM